jgi:hypothetical protein
VISRTPQWVAALTAVLLLPRLWEPLGRDQAVFALVGRLAWDGWLPYRDVFEHKPPGLLLLYALVAPLGDTAPAILDTAAAALTAGLLVALLQPLGQRAALLAGLLYALLARHPNFGGFWDIAQPEPLQELALVLGAWAAVKQRWTAVGLAVSAALSLKFTLVLAAPAALLAAWPDRRAVGRVALGLVLPVALLAAAMGLAGGLRPMLESVIAFNQRHAAHGALELQQFPAALAGNARHFGLAFCGVAAIAFLSVRYTGRRLVGLVGLVLLAAVVQALIQAKLWAWHWQAVVLPLCALAGMGLATLRPRWQIPLGVAALILATPGWLQYHARHPWPAHVAGSVSRAEWLQGYTWGRRDWSAIEIAATGAWLRQRAEPQDRLFVWGFEPGIYLSSGLRPATRWIYDYPLTVALDPAQKRAGLAEIAVSLPQTRWWVVMSADRNALESQPSDAQLLAIPELISALQRDYTLVERVGDAAIYQRIAARSPTGPLDP